MTMMHDTEAVLEPLRARLRAANAGRPAPSPAHLLRKAYSDLIQRLTSTDVVIGDEDAEPVEPVKRTRKRKPSVAGVIQQMKRAGVEIAGCEINPRDGTVKIITGKPVGSNDIVGGSDIEMDDDTTTLDRSEWN